MLKFGSDYLYGAQSAILARLAAINGEAFDGYGLDSICDSARRRIALACGLSEEKASDIFFVSGGTQANACVISAVLRPHEAVLSADTGHVSAHEAGAIEATGHEVLTIPHTQGKLSTGAVREYMRAFHGDANHDHMAFPALVYISQPTEYGTLYSLRELKALRAACDEFGLGLFVDGARLAYALGSPACDVTLPQLAELCDVFYIGGTKCGAMFGEAIVWPRAAQPHFFTHIKQRGALLAKGWMLGVQFDELFRGDLYLKGGQNAVRLALSLARGLEAKGYQIFMHSDTNQQFIVLENSQMKALSNKVGFGFWEKFDENHTVVRFATSWATREADITALLEIL